MFEKIKDYYSKGLWGESEINNAVKKGVITQIQAETILIGD